MHGPLTGFWSACPRCGDHYERNFLVTFRHDLRCWSLSTALYNLVHR